MNGRHTPLSDTLEGIAYALAFVVSAGAVVLAVMPRG
jgi:hypothetical protein